MASRRGKSLSRAIASVRTALSRHKIEQKFSAHVGLLSIVNTLAQVVRWLVRVILLRINSSLNIRVVASTRLTSL